MPPDPSAILQTTFGFAFSKVLLTAVESGVFTTLGGHRLTGATLGAAMGWHPRGIADFLDALLALGFLEREGDGPEALYRNTPATRVYLDEASPHYMGGMMIMINQRLYKFWHDLPEALRSGQPQNETKGGGPGIFETLYADEQKLHVFLNAMTGFSRMNFEALAEKFDFSPWQTLCDVGGATGLLCCEVAKRHPHLQCTSFDLPPVEPVARQAIADAGLASRVAVASGDFFKDPLPRADVITMGMILHDWNLEKKRQLIRAAYEALPEGGAFIVVESLIDDERRVNAPGLIMSLNMLIEFGDAFDYTGADFRDWCKAAGFRKFGTLPLAGAVSAAIAWK